MDWNKVEDQVLDSHLPHTQRAFQAKSALGALRAALDDLKKLGHVFHVQPGEWHAPQEWPKMFYKDNSAKQGEVLTQSVESEEDAKHLGEGWRDTPLANMPKPPEEPEGDSEADTGKLGSKQPPNKDVAPGSTGPAGEPLKLGAQSAKASDSTKVSDAGKGK